MNGLGEEINSCKGRRKANFWKEDTNSKGRSFRGEMRGFRKKKTRGKEMNDDWEEREFEGKEGVVWCLTSQKKLLIYDFNHQN